MTRGLETNIISAGGPTRQVSTPITTCSRVSSKKITVKDGKHDNRTDGAEEPNCVKAEAMQTCLVENGKEDEGEEQAHAEAPNMGKIINAWDETKREASYDLKQQKAKLNDKTWW